MAKHSGRDLAKVTDIAERIQRKVVDTLEPLKLEIRIMGWKPEFSAIMWEAVALEAQRRAEQARRG